MGEDDITNDRIQIPVFSSFKKPFTDKDININNQVTKLADRNVVNSAQNESINSSGSDPDQPRPDQPRHRNHHKLTSVNNIQNCPNDSSQSSSTTISNNLHVNRSNNTVNYVSY